jgi:hypothetical protein
MLHAQSRRYVVIFGVNKMDGATIAHATASQAKPGLIFILYARSVYGVREVKCTIASSNTPNPKEVGLRGGRLVALAC